MKIYFEINDGDDLERWVRDNSWSGAKDRYNSIDDYGEKGWDYLFEYLESGSDMSETELNDFIWFTALDVLIEEYGSSEEVKDKLREISSYLGREVDVNELDDLYETEDDKYREGEDYDSYLQDLIDEYRELESKLGDAKPAKANDNLESSRAKAIKYVEEQGFGYDFTVTERETARAINFMTILNEVEEKLENDVFFNQYNISNGYFTLTSSSFGGAGNKEALALWKKHKKALEKLAESLNGQIALEQQGTETYVVFDVDYPHDNKAKDSQGQFENETKNGLVIKMYFKTKGGKHIIIALRKRPSGADYVVGFNYDPSNGQWQQGHYDFETYDDAEKFVYEKYAHLNPQKTTLKAQDGRGIPFWWIKPPVGVTYIVEYNPHEEKPEHPDAYYEEEPEYPEDLAWQDFEETLEWFLNKSNEQFKDTNFSLESEYSGRENVVYKGKLYNLFISGTDGNDVVVSLQKVDSGELKDLTSTYSGDEEGDEKEFQTLLARQDELFEPLTTLFKQTLVDGYSGGVRVPTSAWTSGELQ